MPFRFNAVLLGCGKGIRPGLLQHTRSPSCPKFQLLGFQNCNQQSPCSTLVYSEACWTLRGLAGSAIFNATCYSWTAWIWVNGVPAGAGQLVALQAGRKAMTSMAASMASEGGSFVARLSSTATGLSNLIASRSWGPAIGYSTGSQSV